MLFLYNLPNWLMGMSVISLVVALAYAGYFAFHGIWNPSLTDEDKGVAMTVLAVVATINSLLLAFSAVSVWEAFQQADAAVVQEANNVSALARDLAIFDSTQSRTTRGMLRDYASQVVQVEWIDMQHGKANPEVWNQFDRMFLTIGAIEPDTPRRVAMLPEIWARTNELLKQRRSRLYTSESEVPGTLWAVVLIGTALAIATTFVLPRTRFNVLMIGALALSHGLVFYLIIAMERPFAGKESIKSEPFTVAIGNMDRWDATIQKTALAP
jgi:hypothetical protein